MHKQYLLIKGKPDELRINEKRNRHYIRVEINGAQFSVTVPKAIKTNFKKMLINNRYRILNERDAPDVNGFNSVDGHKIKVYGKDLLVEIKADTEEELFKESSKVRSTLLDKYGIKTDDKCKWICFK